MRKKIELEYIFSSSVKVLYSRLSTAPGLSEWFADDVVQKNDEYTFIWNDAPHKAHLVDKKPNVFIRFAWDGAEEDEYFEFRIRVEPLTEEVALIITDFVDEEDEDDSVELWKTEVEILHRVLGA